MSLVERFHVNGEPRDAELTDFDGDNWNDVVVAIRDADKVQAYRNDHGKLILSTETPVGRSPREIALADFNNDRCADVVVVNRDSFDVSVLLGCGADAVGFQKLDQTYPVDGEVAGLLVVDVNGDRRADVLQLHRASSEISVRLSGSTGKLSLPTLFPTGLQPNSFEATDVNGDRRLDLITANLGDEVTPGTISILLGVGSGSFAAATTVSLPAPTNQPATRLLAVKAADFDGDGRADLVASFADARIAFFRGNGNGGFAPAANYTNGFPAFPFAVQQFVTGHFDGSNRVDLAGVSFFGEVAVLANDGRMMTNMVFAPEIYTAPELGLMMDEHETFRWYRAREIRLEDVNGDQDPDLVVGLDAGLAIYYGAEGAQFTAGEFQSAPGVPVQHTVPGTDFSVSGFALGDFDGDGDRDLAVSCFVDGCLTILSRTNGATLFREAMKVRVPSSEFVAAGDIDGDGLMDLAGSGRTALWIALSGHEPEVRPSEPLQFNRQKMTHVVINEIMSSNQRTLVGSAGDRYPDWVELYNPTATDVNLAGWRLEMIKPNGTNESFTFPTGQVVKARSRLLVLCANNPGPGLLATGFRLPDGGATLRLRSRPGPLIDVVTYPAQHGDIAYARYADGVSAFMSTMMATPGSPNVYTGPIPPSLKFNGFDKDNFLANVPVQLFAEAADDSTILGVSLSWRRIDVANDPWHRVAFYDDGHHGDGAAADGLFSGTLRPGLPNGAAIQFYLEATDANSATTYLPSSPQEAEDSGGRDLYSLVFGDSRAPVEINEVVSNNDGIFRDGTNGTPDYVELINVSGDPVSLDDYAVVDEDLSDHNRFHFPAGTVLLPGQTILILCDSQPRRGPFHADFALSAQGDKVHLQRRTAAGAYVTIDAVEVPALDGNLAYARVRPHGTWEIMLASPNAPNIPSREVRFRVQPGASGPELVVLFAPMPGAPYSVQTSPTIAGPWSVVATGVGGPGTFIQPIRLTDRSRFFRVRRE